MRLETLAFLCLCLAVFPKGASTSIPLCQSPLPYDMGHTTRRHPKQMCNNAMHSSAPTAPPVASGRRRSSQMHFVASGRRRHCLHNMRPQCLTASDMPQQIADEQSGLVTETSPRSPVDQRIVKARRPRGCRPRHCRICHQLHPAQRQPRAKKLRQTVNSNTLLPIPNRFS